MLPNFNSKMRLNKCVCQCKKKCVYLYKTFPSDFDILLQFGFYERNITYNIKDQISERFTKFKGKCK